MGLQGWVQERAPTPRLELVVLKEPFSQAPGWGRSPLPAWCPALLLAPPGWAATTLMLL